MLDEVEQARVGVVQVLEDERHGARLREPFEERAPRAEELLGGHARLDTE